MERNRFARIGKGVLSKAIGLQAKYVEFYEKGSDVLNEKESGCYNCPIHTAKEDLRLLGFSFEADRIHTMCRECSCSVWTPNYIQKVYVNEKNRYGYQPTLNTNAIKLLLLYHFLQPDAYGFVQNVSIRDLAEALGCTLPTVHACNRVLQKYGYCFTTNGLFDGSITVLLPEYKDYHKTAAEGGRGYVTMSNEMLDKLLSIRNLNTLRLNLKGILIVDNASSQTAKNASLRPVVSSYATLRRFLPRYCKRNVIRKSLEKDDSIFSLSFQSKAVVFQIRDEFAQRNIRSNMIADETEELQNYVEYMNDILEQASEAEGLDEKERIEQILASLHIEPSEKYPALSISLSDYKDLASLAVQYNGHLVRVALGQIYSQFICLNHPVDSMGALARTIIRRHVVFSNAA